MGEAIAIVIAVIAIAVVEVRNFVSSGSKGERKWNIGSFLTLLVLSSGLLIALVLHVRMPNPLMWIESGFRAMGLS